MNMNQSKIRNRKSVSEDSHLSIMGAVKRLDQIFSKYDIKDEKNALGYRDKFIGYVRGLEGKDLQKEYKKKTLFYEFLELQKDIGLDVDLLNNYTMLLTQVNRKLGQVFTPDCVNKLLAKMVVEARDGTFKKFYDCAGGTGSTVIKAYYEWRNKNCSFQSQYNHLIEVDELDTYNCYCCVFNFILRGLNAIVRQKNTLTNETYLGFLVTNKATHDLKYWSWFSDFKIIEGEHINDF